MEMNNTLRNGNILLKINKKRIEKIDNLVKINNFKIGYDALLEIIDLIKCKI